MRLATQVFALRSMLAVPYFEKALVRACRLLSAAVCCAAVQRCCRSPPP